MNKSFFNLSHLKKTQAHTRALIKQGVWRYPSYFFASGFGAGLFPFAPGTAASFIAFLLYFPLSQLSVIYFCLFLFVMSLIAIYTSDQVSRELGAHDEPALCIDEFIGCWVSLISIPTIPWLCFLGFLLFRFFDIVKPFPIRQIDQHVHGGFGMILDDIVAGLFTNGILQIIIFFFLKT